jgi:hypothetical protein
MLMHIILLCLFRYLTPEQADRAVSSMNGQFISDKVIIGVKKMNAALAREMNMEVRADGMLAMGSDSETSRSREGEASLAYRRQFDPNVYDDSIMMPPARSKSICTKIYEYFMMY